MYFLASLMFALSANIDNFVLGLSYGIKRIKINSVSNLIISLITLAGTIISMVFGKIIYNIIPEYTTGIIGGSILIIIGIWSIVSNVIKKPKTEVPDEIVSSESPVDEGKNIPSYTEVFDNPEKLDKDHSGNIDIKESLALGIALSINNLGMGIGGSIAGLNIYLTAGLTFIASFICLAGGCFLGTRYLSRSFNKSAAFISGFIMILLGLFQILF